jgi:hypothetical protein
MRFNYLCYIDLGDMYYSDIINIIQKCRIELETEGMRSWESLVQVLLARYTKVIIGCYCS